MTINKPFVSKFFSNKSSRHRRNLEKQLKNIVAFGNVLDIGGVQKPILNRLSSESHIARYEILDLPNPHINSNQVIDFPINIETRLHDETFRQLKKNNYDFIFCIEVSLYWSDPAQAMTNIANSMVSNSTLYINFHSNYAIQKPNGSDCLRYTYDVIKSYCDKNGLIIEDVILTKVNFVSIIALNIFWKSEKMRRNKCYQYSYVSSFLFKLKKLEN